jgi:predicted ATPase/tRNA A-37 threonylcarbamoyl transferase component Bud32
LQFSAGERFGDLLIEEEIGRGAFATVYRARDTVIERAVALKVVHRGHGVEGARRARMMLREARMMAALKSPHLVTLYRLHHPDEETYLFEMELIVGCSLEERLATKPPLTESEIRTILEGILRGLAVAHAHPILHRDIKPANVLLGEDGVVKLADFGLGHLIGSDSLSSQDGSRLTGTPIYLAPEVFSGRPASAASDLWSVGVVLYRMLSGRLPYESRTLPQLFVALANEEPAPLAPQVAPGLAALCMRCLTRDPEARIASAAEMLRLLCDPSEKEAPSTPLVLPTPSRLPQAPTMLGRQDERVRLRGVLETTIRSGRGSVALVRGEVGCGKSTLLQTLAEDARSLGMRTLMSPLAPIGGLRRALLRALRHDLGLSQPGSQVAIVASQERFGESATAIQAMLVGELPGTSQDRDRFTWSLEELLRALAAEDPLLLVLDDLHLANAEDLRLLLDVLRHLADAPVSIAAALRSDDLESSSAPDAGFVAALHDLQMRPGTTQVDLEPLPPEVIHALLEREAGGASFEVGLLEVVVGKAEGNPLYALEVLRELRRGGAAVAQDGRLTLSGHWDRSQLPRRFQDLVIRRVGLLSDDERMLLDVAAVDGVEFDGQAVTVVLGLPLLAGLQRLQRLQRQHGLVHAAGEGYRFAHVLYRDVVYDQIAPELRRELHRLLAEHLEGRGPDAAVEPERLGRHFERAGQAERARPYLLAAAKAAAARQDNLRALDLARRAGALGAATPPETVRDLATLLLALAACQSDLGRTEARDEIIDAVEAAGAALQDEPLRLRAAVVRSHFAFEQQGVSALDGAALEEAVARLPACREQGLALMGLARIALAGHGDAQGADVWAVRAEQVFRAHKEEAQLANLIAFRAIVARSLREPLRAEALLEEAGNLSRRLGRRTNAAIVDANLAHSRFLRGEFDGVEKILVRAKHVFALAGFDSRAGHTAVHLARLHYAEGKLPQALEETRQGLALLDDGTVSGSLAYALFERAPLLIAHGELEEAGAVIARLEAVAEGSGFSVARMQAHALRAQERALAGDMATARREFDTTLALAAEEGDPANCLDVAGRLAVALLLTDLEGAARLAALLPDHPEGGADEDDELQRVRLLVAAAAATEATPLDPAPLERAGKALLAAQLGERRAELRAVALWLVARAAWAAGDRSEARRQAQAALSAANALGHTLLRRHAEEMFLQT